MKFTRSVALAVFVAATTAITASAFVAPRLNHHSTTRPVTSIFAIEDLEAKLLGISSAPAKPTPKPAPAVAPKPAPVVAVEKPKPVKVETPKPVKVETPKPVKTVQPPPEPKPEKPKPEPKAKVAPPPPKKIVPVPVPKPQPKKAVAPAAVATSNGGDLSTIAAGVALGGAPLALAGLAVLAAARSTLAATAERREKIQAEIARREAQKKAFTASADAGGLAQAAGLLGAAFVSLGLIVANPIGDVSNDFQLPSLSLPSIGQTAPTSKVVTEPAPPSPGDLARAKIRAAQAARLEEKRLANEAKIAAASAKVPPRAQGGKSSGSSTVSVDSYESLFSRATSAGPQAVAPAKVEKAVKATKSASEVKAVLPEDALKEAKLLQSDAQAVVKVIDVEEKKVEKNLAEVEQAEVAAAAKAGKLAEEAKAAVASALVQEKASSDQEAAQKAAAEAVQAKEAAAKAALEAKELAKKEAQLSEEAARLQAEEKAAEKIAAAAKAAAEKIAEQEKLAASAAKAAAEKLATEEKAAAAAKAAAAPAAPTVKAAPSTLPSDMQVSDETLNLLRSLKKK